jgi:hypothetical protein
MLTNTGTGANYLAFDIMGDLAFDAPFGMVNAAKDFAVVPRDKKDQDSAMSSVAVTEIPVVKILNGRATVESILCLWVFFRVGGVPTLPNFRGTLKVDRMSDSELWRG